MTGNARPTRSDAPTEGSLAVDDADPALAARATVYGVLVRLFDEPDETVHAAIEDGSLADELAALCERSGLDVDPPRLETGDDPRTLRARFNDLFEVGVPKPPVPLYESSHRDDASWQEINLDLARAYDYFGLAVDESNREDHDHLRLQLEFASYLARREALGDRDARDARGDFLDRHLSVFADRLSDSIEAEANTDVYGDLAAFLDAFVRADHRTVGHHST
ncbi:molecular chaperone TorD family protein [Salinilacihabitans rarus]|uniref:molecular chaperone TorD family protein n=1 Tax=Salinilacihabitans rarus TaxID=2961596 RepID=UPI0020C889B6|nr:molecular chaperone TorD family protein [Salinilacihabitans rarus]